MQVGFHKRSTGYMDTVSGATQLIQASDLLRAWTGRTIRGRYQQSALGWLWALVQPIASVALMTIVFTQFVPIDTGDIPYPVFSYIAVVPWTFFASSVTDMTGSLIANMGLVTKIYFPREVLPISAMLARLMDFGIALSLLLVLLIVYRVSFNPAVWLFLPLILGIQMMLIIGIGLITSAANVFFRDVQSLLVLGIQLWFYATPIIYPVSMVPEQLRTVYFLNPMAGVIVAYRDVVLAGEAPGLYLVPSALVSIVLLSGGIWFFRRVEYMFADIV